MVQGPGMGPGSPPHCWATRKDPRTANSFPCDETWLRFRSALPLEVLPFDTVLSAARCAGDDDGLARLPSEVDGRMRGFDDADTALRGRVVFRARFRSVLA